MKNIKNTVKKYKLIIVINFIFFGVFSAWMIIERNFFNNKPIPFSSSAITFIICSLIYSVAYGIFTYKFYGKVLVPNILLAIFYFFMCLGEIKYFFEVMVFSLGFIILSLVSSIITKHFISLKEKLEKEQNINANVELIDLYKFSQNDK